MTPVGNFREANFRKTAIRDLQLSIAGTRIEPLIETFLRELDAVGIVKLRPTFYLSAEWGVSFGSTGIGIPFYLAHPELIAVHSEEVGFRQASTERSPRCSRILASPNFKRSEIAQLPAADLIGRIEQRLMADVYRWAGHFPEQDHLTFRYAGRDMRLTDVKGNVVQAIVA